MTYYVNGKEIEIKKDLTVEQILLLEGFQLKQIAVEYNGNILPKLQYSNQLIKANDKLEVVSFVGGG
ncbi:MAG: sulfur carrier protein ThiS [Lachnotalea sp.]